MVTAEMNNIEKTFLLIMPTGGLNDIFNQVARALDFCVRQDMAPVVSLELAGEYENQIDELLNCAGSCILNHKTAIAMGIMPDMNLLLELRENSTTNSAVQVEDKTFAWFGTGGGIRKSSGIIARLGLAESILSRAFEAYEDTDFRTACVHLRCKDLSPDTRVLEKFMAIAGSATVYSDGDYSLYIPGDESLEGFKGSKKNARSSDDLVTLLLMSLHHSVILIPIRLDETNKQVQFSGFGLLALSLHLRRLGPRFILRKGTRFSLSQIFIRDKRLFIGLIASAIWPRVSKKPWKQFVS